MNAATGWAITGAAGTFRPYVLSYPDGIAPQGQNVGFLGPTFGDSPSSLDQSLGASLVAETLYTLTVLVGQRQDTSLINPVHVAILAGAQPIADADSAIPFPGAFVSVSVSYHARVDEPWAGQPLRIVLSLPPRSGVADVDDVRLEIRSAPIPGALPALLLGLTLLPGRRGRPHYRVDEVQHRLCTAATHPA